MKYNFSTKQYSEIMAAKKANRDNQTNKRLEVLELRCKGKSLKEISEITGFHRSYVSNLIRNYFEEGLTSVLNKRYQSNTQNKNIDIRQDQLKSTPKLDMLRNELLLITDKLSVIQDLQQKQIDLLQMLIVNSLSNDIEGLVTEYKEKNIRKNKTKRK